MPSGEQLWTRKSVRGLRGVYAPVALGLPLLISPRLKRPFLRLADPPAALTGPVRLDRAQLVVDRDEAAFDELIAEADDGFERTWRTLCRVVFLTVMGTGMRRGEILGLRWRNVHLADPDGARLHVRETIVWGQPSSPKSAKGERTLSIGPRLADELFQHRARTVYAGDDEAVFCQPYSGATFDHKRYGDTLQLALDRAGVEKRMRPFHDGRHSSITNSAAAGMSPAALMARAGHADFGTTQRYIDLAGETFRAEAELLEGRLWGDFAANSAAKSPLPVPALATETSD